MIVFALVERRGWQEWAIVGSILALAVVGFLAIWGDAVSELWDRDPTASESTPAPPTTGTSL